MKKLMFSELNRQFWAEATALHLEPNGYYDIEGFKQGTLSLRPLEIREVGRICGRSLLHLQCHFGLDTLSWKRLGAVVTGIDFDKKSIAYARALADELAINARFICCDVYDASQYLSDQFDVVFTSYGTLRWLPDLRRWAEMAFTFLNPGGFLYVVDTHPLLLERLSVNRKAVCSDAPFSSAGEPPEVGVSYDYAQKGIELKSPRCIWKHRLEHITKAIINAGFCLDFVREHEFCDDAYLPEMTRNKQGWWILPESDSQMPLMFSIKASVMKYNIATLEYNALKNA